MSLNIKDPEALRLAGMERRRNKASINELLDIADRAAAHLERPYVDHGELLYDDSGLPLCSREVISL